MERKAIHLHRRHGLVVSWPFIPTAEKLLFFYVIPTLHNVEQFNLLIYVTLKRKKLQHLFDCRAKQAANVWNAKRRILRQQCFLLFCTKDCNSSTGPRAAWGDGTCLHLSIDSMQLHTKVNSLGLVPAKAWITKDSLNACYTASSKARQNYDGVTWNLNTAKRAKTKLE